MKRAAITIMILSVVFVGAYLAFASTPELFTTLGEKVSAAREKLVAILPASENADDQDAQTSESQSSSSEGGWSLPLFNGSSFGTGILKSGDEAELIPIDDYGQNYVFYYGGEEFSVYFDGYSWKIYDSYKIADHGDIVKICQALIDEHPIYGSDWESLRTAEDMAFEWEQHNIAYQLLPEGNHWRDKAKDADLNPDDQGKTYIEMYEARTGQKFDVRNYLPGI